MDKAWEQQRQELAEKLRQTMERVWAEFDTDDPDWAPLETALPVECQIRKLGVENVSHALVRDPAI